MVRTIIDKRGVVEQDGESGLEIRVPVVGTNSGLSPFATSQNAVPTPLTGAFVASPGHWFVSGGANVQLPDPSTNPGAIFSFTEIGAAPMTITAPAPGIAETDGSTGTQAQVNLSGSLVVQSMGLYYLDLGHSGSLSFV